MKKPGLVFAAGILATLATAAALADGEILIIGEDTETILLDNGEQETGITEQGSGEVLIIDDGTDTTPAGESGTIQLIEEAGQEQQDEAWPAGTVAESHAAVRAGVDQVWIEYGNYLDDNGGADHHGYAHTEAFASWTNSSTLEARASLRIDGYVESGGTDWEELTLDYGETYLRYSTENATLTAGAQKILWGRIDEFPPIDRLSTQDLRRFILDDLADRRLASPAFRYERFFDTGKLDLVFYPVFREAELPDKDSVWYPVNRNTGEVLGLDLPAPVRNIVRTRPIDDNPPHSEGGVGIRYSNVGPGFGYGLSVQKGRQTVPYFRYNPERDLIESRYPRSWTFGGDLAFEALGGTLKLEAAWLSDVPVTRRDGGYEEVEAISWGGALEIFPGDGDLRLNLQIVGHQLIDAPSVYDQSEIYAFNGSIELPSANQQWRFKTRFYAGLKERDLYLNPEIAYIGLDAQEIYLDLHYLDGTDGTFGGFYDDHNLLTLGWRAYF